MLNHRPGGFYGGRIPLPQWTLVLATLAIAWTSPVPPGHTPVALAASSTDATAQSPLYAMPPGEFFDSEVARRQLDLSNINHPALSAAIFHATNHQRMQHSLKPLEHKPAIEEAARMHATAMAEGGYLSHEQPDPARRTPTDRVRLAGFQPTYVAENVATAFALQYESGRPIYRLDEGTYSYSPDGQPIPPHTYASFARALLDQWMNSPEHRQNILANEPTLLSTAATPAREQQSPIPKLYCVQVFARP